MQLLPPDPCDRAALEARLVALGAWLEAWRDVWSARAFMEQPVAWEARLPELAAWLRALDPAEVEAFEVRPEQHPGAPEALRALAAEAAGRVALPSWGSWTEPGHPPRHVPDRKWGQIQSFLAPLGAVPEPVEWCAGKGHLARSLALHSGGEVHAVERDPALCETGADLARRAGARVRFHVADVLADPLEQVVVEGRTLLGLHACGDLTTRALDLATARHCAGIAVAPCCFHRMSGDHYQPSSSAGRRLDLRLTRDEARLPSSEEVVAPRRMRRLRRREMHARLVVDRLLRDRTGVDRYRPLRSVPEAWTNGPLDAFVAQVSARDGLGLAPTAADLRRAEAWAAERVHVARALGMMRAPFRRPLELWLALDRALALAERGWQVRLGTFCPARITPRNVLLVGLRG